MTNLSNLTEIRKGIENGTFIYKRFSQGEQRGFTKGGSRHVEASIIAGRQVETRDTQDRRNDRQETDVETYAREIGIWYENTEEYLTEKYGEPINSGQESLVYDNGKTVIKTSNTLQYWDLEDALDSITLHNTYFPESAIVVIGFGMDAETGFQIIKEQPYITEIDRRATQEEIDIFIEKLNFVKGLSMTGTGGRYQNNNVLISDLVPKNVIMSVRGIVAIDPIMHLNTANFGRGGNRIPENSIENIKIWETK